ncbi:MAG: hypothetical protein NZ455_01335 [Bacteroidia bacterium]|nr:hypothetical protein [Bacteroidia bacterium]MDW8346526.1 hypothetical protein [Bacteroidia bacterium]
MRRACDSTVRSPSPTLLLLPRGAAPLARSTPTRAQRGTRPKYLQLKITSNPLKTIISLYLCNYVLDTYF